MLQRSPLDDAHRALGAKMAPFAGWEMPVSYAGTLGEHEAVRERAGIFDVSHLGKLLVSGAGATAYLDSMLSNRMSDLAAGRARYTLMLDDDAGIVDDLIVYAIGVEEMLVVPNASNVDEVRGRLQDGAPATVHVEHLSWSTIAVQGPRSLDAVADRLPSAKGLGYMGVAREGSTVVARSGYTGELGFEVFTTVEDARATWDALLDAVGAAGGEPCGLGARDTLRLEMGYPLHGNDIDRSTTPAEAGLMWAVKLEGRSFPGRDALAGPAPTERGAPAGMTPTEPGIPARPTPARRLIGLRMRDRVIPRRGCAVLDEAGRTVGRCTSGTFSPTLKAGIALAYVAAGEAGRDELTVEVRGRTGRAAVVTPPFVDRTPKVATGPFADRSPA